MEKSIGILGGTFDPIHLGHIYMAECAYRQFGLDKILFMPSPNPPHKSEFSDINYRTDMVKLAIKDLTFAEFSDYELKKQGKAYTSDTLTSLKQENPDTKIYFILGTDSLFDIERWNCPEDIFRNAAILAAPRENVDNSMTGKKYNLEDDLDKHIVYLMDKYNAEIHLISMDTINISSSKIRNIIDNGKDFSQLVTPEVYYYIQKKRIRSLMDESRFIHTLGVADTAKKMALRFGANENKAYMAGLLHDCAKCISDNEKVNILNQRGIDITPAESNNKFLLHAKVGAVFAKEKFGITDTEILNAIKYHTTGKPNMTLLEKIIFTADYIEPGRYKQKNLQYIREISMENIDKAVAVILKDTLKYLSEYAKNDIDTLTVKAYNYYSSFLED
ncbi:MAG: nicotinate-nucleotide adenylyltransferase [Eubacterium sp.]